MRRTTLPLIMVLTLAGAACGGPGVVIRSGPTEDVFVPQVVDPEDAPGRGVSLAIDADGNPHLAYLAFESNEAGGPPAPEGPDAPKLPEVRHAHLVEGLWTRSVVADDQQTLGAADATAIAVDGDGVHHVVWTSGDSLFYSNNAGGAEFSKPERVAADVIGGVSVAAGDGRVAVSFFQGGGGGAGSLVRVAIREGDRWTIETAAEGERGPESGTAVGFSGDTILVAFGDSGRTMVSRSGAIWASDVADPDIGGDGISMDVDADGNPHLSYTTAEGEIRHAHSIGGGPWEISVVGDGVDGPTSIAVHEEGVHHVAWEWSGGIAYASNQEGEFRAEEVPGTTGAELPRIGVGAEGTVYLAWFDPTGAGLILAIRSDREPLLAVPQPSPTGGPTVQPTGPAPCQPSGTTLTITAPPGAVGAGFDKDCLAAPAGEAFTIEFDNQDTGQIHNVNIFTDSSASESLLMPNAEGGITAPDQTTYEGDPIEDPGQYFFRCDFHPTAMTGTFVVQ